MLREQKQNIRPIGPLNYLVINMHKCIICDQKITENEREHLNEIIDLQIRVPGNRFLGMD